MDYKRYNEQVKNMDQVIMPSDLPKRKIDFGSLVKYAKEKNIDIKALSAVEKEQLMAMFEDE